MDRKHRKGKEKTLNELQKLWGFGKQQNRKALKLFCKLKIMQQKKKNRWKRSLELLPASSCGSGFLLLPTRSMIDVFHKVMLVILAFFLSKQTFAFSSFSAFSTLTIEAFDEVKQQF